MINWTAFAGYSSSETFKLNAFKFVAEKTIKAAITDEKTASFSKFLFNLPFKIIHTLFASIGIVTITETASDLFELKPR